jgi:hypothetical protein
VHVFAGDAGLLLSGVGAGSNTGVGSARSGVCTLSGSERTCSTVPHVAHVTTIAGGILSVNVSVSPVQVGQ